MAILSAARPSSPDGLQFNPSSKIWQNACQGRVRYGNRVLQRNCAIQRHVDETGRKFEGSSFVGDTVPERVAYSLWN